MLSSLNWICAVCLGDLFAGPCLDSHYDVYGHAFPDEAKHSSRHQRHRCLGHGKIHQVILVEHGQQLRLARRCLKISSPS